MIFPNKLSKIPLPSNQERLEIGLEKWSNAVQSSDFSTIIGGKAQGKIAKSIFGSSPYLTKIFVENPQVVRDVFENGVEKTFYNLIECAKNELKLETDTSKVSKNLRILKKIASLVIAMGDIAGETPLYEATKYISILAQTALQIALEHLLYLAHQSGEIELKDIKNIQKDCGYIILGMGKLGAFELNYSSDIDLIVLYDEEKVTYKGRKDIKQFFIKLTQNLVKIIDARTADGYVFRTDLRLRPDPSSTPIAMSILAAEAYYECYGQNWERAAMIKSRCVAGDKDSAEVFFKNIKPFVWRRSLDFKAIADIHSIKRQIRSRHGSNYLSDLKGVNIKLGRGGIREIEFFAQTQQLIWGGRNPKLRENQTVNAIKELTKAKFVEKKTCDDMAKAYEFLRRLEHRLQMVDDAQTQELPKSDDKFLELALFMGYENVDDFNKDVTYHLQKVEEHYANLFNDSPSLSEDGNLVFTGNEDDPETLETLAKFGFSMPQSVASTIRGWHSGKIRATRSAQARELLTELIPDLLKALSNTTNPDMAFSKFDGFFSSLPAGVQLLHLFHSNPALLNLVAEIMGDAPKLAENLSKKPFLLDNVLQPDFFNYFPSKKELEEELGVLLKQDDSFELMLDLCRSWTKNKSFQIGTLSLKNIISGKKAGLYLSYVTDTVLSLMLPYVMKDFERLYGAVTGAGVAIVAMGKVGGREMTTSSDLDLIFIYDNPKGEEKSDGKKMLPVSQYFIRFVQKYVSSVTSMTAEGKLWEIDMRLRPSGNAGPLATSYQSFESYQKNEAWTWEHMALNRARVICSSDKKLQNKIEKTIKSVLCVQRDGEKLRQDVLDMRGRIAQSKKGVAPWDIKHMNGGMVDIEFIIQYLQLKNSFENPELLQNSNLEAIKKLQENGALSKQDADVLYNSYDLFLTIKNLFSQTVTKGFDEKNASVGLKMKLAEIIDEKDISKIRDLIMKNVESVSIIFKKIIGDY
jgi:glutamate-ammonia-ligase adenylyltransferase